jgi:Protein of unknown function (DUF2587)
VSEQMPQTIDPSVPSPLEVVAGPGPVAQAEEPPATSINEPAKVMRIGSMIKLLLEEVRQAPLDDRSRVRLREIFETSVRELSTALSPDLTEELQQLALPFHDNEIPSDAELRVAQAQLVGWLEGLFHGIQATLVAQQMAAQNQLAMMRQRGLPPGAMPPDAMGAAGPSGQPDEARSGTYL